MYQSVCPFVRIRPPSECVPPGTKGGEGNTHWRVRGRGEPIRTTGEKACTVIRFFGVSAKFGACTVVSVNGILVEAEMLTFTLESTHFVFNKCLIYNHDGASAKFSTNSHETDYSVALLNSVIKHT